MYNGNYSTKGAQIEFYVEKVLVGVFKHLNHLLKELTRTNRQQLEQFPDPVIYFQKNNS